jgi:hypothetical protein
MHRRWSTPKVLVLFGVLVMVGGRVTTIVGLYLQDTCMAQQNKINGMDVAASVAQCSGYNDAAGFGYLTLVLGAGLVLLAAMTDTPVWRNRRRFRRSTV